MHEQSIKDALFAWPRLLAMLANDRLKLNNPINSSLINLNTILSSAFFIKYFQLNIFKITNINSIIINKKVIHTSI